MKAQENIITYILIKPGRFVIYISIAGSVLVAVITSLLSVFLWAEVNVFILLIASLSSVIPGFILFFLFSIAAKRKNNNQQVEAGFAELIQLTDDFFFVADLSGKLLYINQSLQKKLGYPKDEIPKLTIETIHPREEHKRIQENLALLKKEKKFTCKFHFITKEGQQFPVESTAKITYWNNQQLLICISRNLEAQNEMQLRLGESEQRYREMAEMLPEMVCEMDNNGKIIFANKHAYLQFGYTREDLNQGVNIRKLLIDEDIQRAEENLKKRLEGMDSMEEYTAQKKDGTRFPIGAVLRPVFRKSEHIGFRGVLFNLTEQKIREQELQESFNYVQHIIQNVPIGLLTLNDSGNVVSINETACELLKIDGQSLDDQWDLSVLDESFHPLKEAVDNALLNKSTTTRKIKLIDEDDIDDTQWYNITIVPYSQHNLQIYLLIVDDITQQVVYEKELKELNIEISTQNMTYLAQNKEIRRINDLLKENQHILKDKTDELEILTNNINIQIWYLISPEKYGTINQAHADFFGTTIFDMSHTVVKNIVLPEQYQAIHTLNQEVFLTGREISRELWLRNKKGQERLLHITLTPKLNEEGQPDFVIGTAVDKTIQFIAEEKIKRNTRLQEYLSNISFVFNTLDQFDEIINKSIQLAGEQTQVSRVYVFELLSDGYLAQNTYEWVNANLSSELQTQHKVIDLRQMPSFRDMLQNGEGIFAQSAYALPIDMQPFINSRLVKSVLIRPIIVENVMIGFIGFDVCENHKIWENFEIEIIKTLANLISNHFAKRTILNQLIEARDVAEKANEAKSRFLASMSHEIRTPMNAILGYARILEKSNISKAFKEKLNVIIQSGKNLLALINDILDLSKIEAGKLEITKKPVNIPKLLNEIKTIFTLKNAEKGIDFFVDLQPDMPLFMMLDETRLRQVLFNLVGNAVKFTEQGSVKLQVGCTFLNDSKSRANVFFTVEDTGIGIAPDQFKEIFEAFQQQRAQNQKYGGTGLGLTITKRLVKMMNGIITLSSELGKGSQFTVELFDVNSDVRGITEEDKHATTELNIDFKKAKVLVVEDNHYNQNIVKSFLHDRNVLIYQVWNGKEAIKSLQEITPDIILLDLNMPEMDGIEVMRTIRSESKWRNIPIIVMTSDVLEADKQQNLATGCDGYLLKPIEEEKIVNELTRFLDYEIQTESNNLVTSLNQNDLLFRFKELSPEAKNHLAGLLSVDMRVHWETSKKSMQLNQWKRFANELHTLGKELDCSPLLTYSFELNSSLEDFNINALRNKINMYPKILEALAI